MLEFFDISIENRRAKGERRKGVYGFNSGKAKPEQWTNPVNKNPFQEILNHRKHCGQLYRKAEGGFETKGKPRYHVDWYD